MTKAPYMIFYNDNGRAVSVPYRCGTIRGKHIFFSYETLYSCTQHPLGSAPDSIDVIGKNHTIQFIYIVDGARNFNNKIHWQYKCRIMGDHPAHVEGRKYTVWVQDDSCGARPFPTKEELDG